VEEDLPRLASKYLPDLAASLCGGLKTGSVSLVSFEEHLLTYSQFVDKLRNGSHLLDDPNLVIRLHEKYLSWPKAAPILLSILLFRQPLSEDLVADIVKDGIDVNVNLSAEEVLQVKAGAQDRDRKKSSTWFGWWGAANKHANNNSLPDVKQQQQDVDGVNVETGIDGLRTQTDFSGQTEDTGGGLETDPETWAASVTDEESNPHRCRKTLRLSSDRLAELNLRPGSNEVTFSVATAFQGTTVCRCHIYLWHQKDKVVISDIDGTITKSDVLGHILPVIGQTWAQSGVAQLFSKIRGNGYHIMYLSARVGDGVLDVLHLKTLL